MFLFPARFIYIFSTPDSFHFLFDKTPLGSNVSFDVQEKSILTCLLIRQKTLQRNQGTPSWTEHLTINAIQSPKVIRSDCRATEE